MRRWLLWPLVCVCCGLGRPLAWSEGNTDSLSSAIYLRQTNRLVQAWLFKPTEPVQGNLVFDLAPLILQEVRSGRAAKADLFGELCVSNGVPLVGRGKQVIYAGSDVVDLNGQSHPRLSYVWFYPPASSPETGVALPAQGVRMTVDVSGRPAVWEVLGDTTRTQIIFVSKSLEEAAQGQFGPPLAGRDYAIERDPMECTNVIVARVIEDGPLPMGPIIYLSAGSRSVSTLICRCMPAQSQTLVGTSRYELCTSQHVRVEEMLRELSKDRRLSLWLESGRPSQSLKDWLRLPRTF